MVYIKSLIVEGFKSFKERTRINFSKGFTSIVGANGSGKSNILDAFVFALGELSGNKMRVNNIKDLICNGGTNGGKPSKWARVDIIFDNSDRRIPIDSDTVKISRKINIQGQGKYYINDKATTRRELQDIMDIAGLIPNSSNLILQGELFRIINMNNNERRQLIEEISGIASYNEKKERAEKDLLKVEENLSRITLLLNEVSIQLDSLEKEKNDALKYQEYDIKQKTAEKVLIMQKIKEIEKQIEKINSKKLKLEEEINQINEISLVKRNELMKISTELSEINDKIKSLQLEELEELTSKLNELKTELTKKETQKDNYNNEITKLRKKLVNIINKKENLNVKKENLKVKLSEKETIKSEISEKLKDLKEELYHSEEQARDLNTEYVKFQNSLDNLKNQIQEVINEKNGFISELKVLNNRLKTTENNHKTLLGKKKRILVDIDKYKKDILELEEQEKKLKNTGNNSKSPEDIESKKQIIDKKLRELRKQIELKHSELIELKSKIKAVKNFSRNKAIDAILNLKDYPEKLKQNGISGKIYGTIAQLGKTRADYDLALKVAGGGKFNFIVVDSQDTAKKCINFLKKNKLGRASFIPLDKIRANPISLNVKQNNKIIGRAVDLIEFNPLFTRAFEFVFGRTIVVSDINAATQLEVNAKRVTLDGDVIESSNLMTGGNIRNQNQIGFGSIEESKIPELESELSNLKNLEQNYLNRLKELEREITRIYRNRISMNNNINEIKQKLAVSKSKLESKNIELQEIDSEIGLIIKDISEIKEAINIEEQKLRKTNTKLANLKKEETELKNKLNLLKNNDFTRKIAQLRNEIDNLEKQKINLNLEITRIRTQLEELIESTEIELNDQINSLKKDIEHYTFELEKINSEIENLRLEKESVEQKLTEKNEIIGKFYREKESLLKKQTALKIELEDLKSSIHPKNIKINTLDINKNNLERQKEELSQELSNRFEINIEENDQLEELFKMNSEKLLTLIEECKRIKASLEPVNMRAIKKYDKIKKRYDELIEKHEIVVEERYAILDFIEKIEKEKKAAFLNTFEGINSNFKEIFAKLSPGGEAKLELENEEDPFAGGVKMLARPGGKKWCLTQAMSGGEKTLTVIALVLGIQMYVPSPYYILDEIDAALDDYNAMQVASMIKELSEKSQFILITHRDVTMAKTDQLLGVSNTHGLTSVINLNIKQALEQVAKFQKAKS
ncbi:MAG: chromosome segregation protein SMC [Promethearchaeota archaeon]